jgi:hypothetical protein
MEQGIRLFAAAAILSAVTAACSSEDRAEEPVRSAPARISFTQEAKLLASDGVAADYFGGAAAISGDTVAVSSLAPQSVYVFVRSGGTWGEQQKLALGGDPGAVALAGDTLLAGAPFSGFGLVHTFTRAGGAWSPEPTLSPPAGNVGQFGASVAIEGDTAVIGAPAALTGAAFVYVRSGATWALQASLYGGSPATDGGCGNSVAISGDTVLVGCSTSKDPMDSQNPLGAAYAFKRSGATWELQQKLPQMGQTHFGSNVAISGDTAAIGTDSGTHLLTRSGGAWALQTFKSVRRRARRAALRQRLFFRARRRRLEREAHPSARHDRAGGRDRRLPGRRGLKSR